MRPLRIRRQLFSAMCCRIMTGVAMKRCFLFFSLLVSTSPLSASFQDPQFEAATIKPNIGMSGVSGGCRGIDSSSRLSSIPLGRCVITAARLSHAIGIAFKLEGMQTIKGGPEWLMTGAERYDIIAK